MNCKDVKIFLYSFLDGELDSKESSKIEAHLENCEKCRKSYEFEFELKRKITDSLKKDELTIKVPEHLKEAIINKKVSTLNRIDISSFINMKNLAAIASIFFVVFFISPSFVGYTTLSDENIKDYSKKIENYSNSKKDINKWFKEHSLYSSNFLNIDKTKINITPIGFSLKKEKPIVYYHYKGKKLLYKRMYKKLKETDLKTIMIKKKKFFVKKSKGLYNLYWYNKDILNSLTGNLTSKDVKKIITSLN